MKEEAKISHYAIKKIFFKHKGQFPTTLTKLYITKHSENNFSIEFLSYEDDVTHLFYRNVDVYELFRKAVISIQHLIDVGKVYTFTAPLTNNGHKVYLDKDLLNKIRLNKNLSVPELSNYSCINPSTIYTVERGEPLDAVISSVINYSLFFKKPLHSLFTLPYKKEMLNILLNDFMVKGYIESDKAKEIFNKEIN
jgi:hypothetical protein